MNGAQFNIQITQKAGAMMRLRGNRFDASKRVTVMKAFKEIVVPLSVGAKRKSGHWVLIARVFMHQSVSACASVCALTSGSSGPANSPLRSAFAAH
jgi:hypothetical protein